ncbi:MULTISPECIES: FGGY-family carbohydrate kinase [unclassified Mesorhizobium]|uniref:FGGY-family carbohydrate kinase n=1 Tax=unclassified Mesorhizobium TaxID=325217 RepID=UPI000FE97F84|nr:MULTISPECIES: FGGY-family carbohydrate kinase [unclassified Mesorhizobium]RWC72925.1 MAG: carbohydrate kinase [Mesorhizobium sp.]TGV10232.1 carbohydrate kinase [Mesorhizobium sp. M8A.F.Ca.ET.173.01.1.1]TGP86296.1 carbohydrate kinase [Mesorhizobium sp. M8A.F.Ca.ET.218.01.1.1]TGS38632.1 carbohydrate kinase [Mesorhizobium sp. M8A.F.Ca.ET.182.01.1.1]TGS77128.1 carbohydrate kinase [Mesorhizobium sp. M8A.F.Ca.ET.181.01.1.1]
MTPLVVGIDIGTSGARAVAMRQDFSIAGQSAVRLDKFGQNPRDPSAWWQAVQAALTELISGVDRAAIRAIAIDGTSGTLLPVDADGRPLAEPLMYNDKVDDGDILAAIARAAPEASAAHGATSGLAKALRYQHLPGIAAVLHQADWIAGNLSGGFDVSDENNALKTGYDVEARRWPDWIAATGMRMDLLPDVVEPGDVIGTLTAAAAALFGLPRDVVVVAGTTDGCASFLATGATAAGDGVTALGSSLTIKILSDRPISAPRFGIYSHRLGDTWLAGGASNSGGKVLAQHFPLTRIIELSAMIDPTTETGLDYYPLGTAGERFPIADPALPPRLTPRPADDADYLKAMFEGMAAIEALGYGRLAELGAPALTSIRSVGGGAANPVWSAIRQRKLGVAFLPALSDEAAAGTARLALKGASEAGLL